jgi:hypothetical protein
MTIGFESNASYATARTRLGLAESPETVAGRDSDLVRFDFRVTQLEVSLFHFGQALEWPE